MVVDPIAALSLPTLLCLRSTLEQETDLGPLAVTVYTNYADRPSFAAREHLLTDLGRAFKRNAGRVESKTRHLRWALGNLVVGLLIAAFTLVLK
jgi:hypothetical protein